MQKNEQLLIMLAYRQTSRIVPVAIRLIYTYIYLERGRNVLIGKCIQRGRKKIQLIHRRYGNPDYRHLLDSNGYISGAYRLVDIIPCIYKMECLCPFLDSLELPETMA